MNRKTILCLSLLSGALMGCAGGVSSEPSSEFSSSAASSSSVIDEVTSVTLNVSEYEIYYEDSYTLEASVYPESASDKRITWSSSNPEVCNVSNGVLVPYKKGTATITATSVSGGKTATCLVTVTDRTDRYGTRTNDSILSDATFSNGFDLKTPHQSPASVEKYLNYENDNLPGASWQMAQWWSPFDFADASFSESGTVKTYQNSNRSLIVDTSTGKISMNLNGAAEIQYYEDTPEEEVDPKLRNHAWPHFLIEQTFDESLCLSPSNILSEGGSIHVKFDVTIDKLDQVKTGVASDCAQLLFYVRVLNKLKEGQSKDEYGNNGEALMWVGVPILDSRYDYVSTYHALDVGMAGATGDLIYSNSSDTYMGKSKPEIGKKYSVDVDILETIHDAYLYGQSHGMDSKYKWDNLEVRYMNLGWEIPGGYDVGATFENLDIYVSYE